MESTGRVRRYLLQQINRHVFREPALVLENMRRVTRHLRHRLARERVADAERRVSSLVPTRAAPRATWTSAARPGACCPGSTARARVERAATEAEARETARAFGRFARRLTDLPPPALHATIPGFHDTRGAPPGARAGDRRRPGRTRGRLPRRDRGAAGPPAARRGARVGRGGGGSAWRPVHNDAKIANLLFDDRDRRGARVVDLDTTMPGLAAHDFGDLVRSGVSDSEEDERDLARVARPTPASSGARLGFLAGIGRRDHAGRARPARDGSRA